MVIQLPCRNHMGKHLKVWSKQITQAAHCLRWPMQVFGGNAESSLSITSGYTTDPKPLGILLHLFLSSSCLVF